MPPKGSHSRSKRRRNERPYEDKSKMSSLVKQWWDIFVTEFLDKNPTDEKIIDFTNLCEWIRQGEKNGKARFSESMRSPSYTDPVDWHTWLTFWLADRNVKRREGCFYNLNLDKTDVYRASHFYILWAKRQRARDAKAAAKGKSPKTRRHSAASSVSAASPEEAESEPEYDMDPSKGTALVRWSVKVPEDMVESGEDRETIKNFCGYSLLEFWGEVDKGFKLSARLQQRVRLAPFKHDTTFAEAKRQAHDTGKLAIFDLHTEPASLPEEAQHVPDSGLPAVDSDAAEVEPENREQKYREMVEEAEATGTNRFDMRVRLWRYNMMLAEARDGGQVTMQDVVLRPDSTEEQLQESAAVQSMQYHFDMAELNKQLSDPKIIALHEEDQDSVELEGPPLTSIQHITAENFKDYEENNTWIDNPTYQPQNHDETCRALNIPNPDDPRMEGLLSNLRFEHHQPTGIYALVGFEGSCVGAGILAEDVGLGKTVEMIGLLLHRSNERRNAIERGETVSRALPTMIVMPQNLIPQWRDGILRFTDRFTVIIYYGAARQSGDPSLVYLGFKKDDRLTRNHEYFNGTESNSDIIIITSYNTLAVRHGPKVQRQWLIDERRRQNPGTTKKEAEEWVKARTEYEGFYLNCPYQLSGLLSRVIIEEGHQIRHQPKEIFTTVNNLNGEHRHVISGTPTFNNLDEFTGLMAFMQNRNLRNPGFLHSLGFTWDEVHEKEDCLESVLSIFNPYEVSDDHPRAPLKYCAEAMQQYIFQPNIALAQQGARMAQVFKKVMVRRTQSSVLNGRSIGAGLPSVQRMIFTCASTEKEREHYDAAYADTSSHLFSKNKDGNTVEQNATTYRKLSL